MSCQFRSGLGCECWSGFPSVGRCDSFQLTHVDTALFCLGNFSQTCVWVSELCLGDGFGNVALLALCVGFFDCGEEDVLW